MAYTGEKLTDKATDTEFSGSRLLLSVNESTGEMMKISAKNVATQFAEEAIVTNATANNQIGIDYTQGRVHAITLTGNGYLKYTFPPAGTSVIVTAVVKGNYTLDCAASGNGADIVLKMSGSDDYNGSGSNYVTLDIMTLSDGTKQVIYSIQNLES